MDPYTEREGLLIAIDLLLLRKEAYCHVLWNSEQQQQQQQQLDNDDDEKTNNNNDWIDSHDQFVLLLNKMVSVADIVSLTAKRLTSALMYTAVIRIRSLI